jgi:hypothetical protein
LLFPKSGYTLKIKIPTKMRYSVQEKQNGGVFKLKTNKILYPILWHFQKVVAR